jgi:type II secretory pathway pseudopilin PulG
MKRDNSINLAIFGFSITDLILVVFIIAILSSILLPISFNIIEKARMTTDQVNARMLYQATIFYASINNETMGTVDQTDLVPYIGNDWPAVLSTMFAGRFSCKIEQNGKIVVTTGSATYDPATGHLLKNT